ncbi:hypothetical protein ACOZ4Y_07950 [Komagataeibacter rhaeticus]|uniref:hypothetical protein n=1 Tax=Komagataeibacter rhaeticus TaxID=215221 RepID=UPI0003149169|nr:hypothetical protein [Komagataeibacter rhaeticus]KDU96496.1 hypothetical protein GLUCORHAEAF1_01315 [Komagataeibacter rhaeticus AF1]MBL7239723.1 hypothetical protein [Komagataeibacter rhaeticus]QOC46160.1 hypothetical protein ICJ78_13780 [Komagataeibacter rhaeticus]WPP21227.1 hypothetical protein SCD25_12505 [Komagataeibacter rhaeticus]SAY49739.1 hypothetical protein KRIGEM_02720 [Komagataeibacter rhaeticus]
MRSFSPVPAVGFSLAFPLLALRGFRQRLMGLVAAAYRRQGMMLLATLPSVAVPSGCHSGIENAPSLLALRGWDRAA